MPTWGVFFMIQFPPRTFIFASYAFYSYNRIQMRLAVILSTLLRGFASQKRKAKPVKTRLKSWKFGPYFEKIVFGNKKESKTKYDFIFSISSSFCLYNKAQIVVSYMKKFGGGASPSRTTNTCNSNLSFPPDIGNTQKYL